MRKSLAERATPTLAIAGFAPRGAWVASGAPRCTELTVAPPTGPSLVLNFNPPNLNIPTSAPSGSVVAAITSSWSDGNPFTGRLSFDAALF
jgi:hypothetical protein